MATTPKFVPRAFLVGDAAQFGWKPTPDWVEPKSLQEAIWKARAQEQHTVVRHLHLMYGRLAHQHLAEATGLGGTRDAWRRKFIGAMPATEDDMVLWLWLAHSGELQHHADVIRDWQQRKDFTASGERRKQPLKRPADPRFERQLSYVGELADKGSRLLPDVPIDETARDRLAKAAADPGARADKRARHRLNIRLANERLRKELRGR